MPHYYFHIHGPNGTTEDDVGSDLADMAAVREEAVTAVREIMADSIKSGKGSNGREMRVADEMGKLVLTLAFRDA
jgi:hypothetical protein